MQHHTAPGCGHIVSTGRFQVGVSANLGRPTRFKLLRSHVATQLQIDLFGRSWTAGIVRKAAPSA